MVDTVVEELARKRLGRTIKGKWRLDRLIGVGGMAAVYAATHRNGARVAIKMLHPTISASTQIRARFVREGYLANKVDNPGVVRILDDDVDDTDQSAFLVMDLVVGTTLAERAMERLLDAGEVLDVADQVLQVLTSAHAQGIVHRDLKPDNLLVDRDGKIHVLDFGIARLLDDGGFSTNTKTGTAFGTPGFMAPEQALGKTNLISPRTDLYALGATLFALVCGDFVHAAENPQELLVLVATQPARSLAELAPSMQREVVAIIDKACENDPNKRWASASAMLEAVREARRKLGVESVRVLPLNAPLPTPPPQPVAAPVASTPAVAVEPKPSPFDAVSRESQAARLSSPEAMTVGALGTQSPGAPGVPLAVASPMPVETPARRPRVMPVLLVGGGAALLGVIAIVAATTTGRGSASKSTGTPTSAPTATELAKTVESTSASAPTPSTTETQEPVEEVASAAPSAAATQTKPTGKLPPASKGSAKATAGPPHVPASSTSPKKIDLGY